MTFGDPVEDGVGSAVAEGGGVGAVALTSPARIASALGTAERASSAAKRALRSGLGAESSGLMIFLWAMATLSFWEVSEEVAAGAGLAAGVVGDTSTATTSLGADGSGWVLATRSSTACAII
jgi:hypothetical protein